MLDVLQIFFAELNRDCRDVPSPVMVIRRWYASLLPVWHCRSREQLRWLLEAAAARPPHVHLVMAQRDRGSTTSKSLVCHFIGLRITRSPTANTPTSHFPLLSSFDPNVRMNLYPFGRKEEQRVNSLREKLRANGSYGFPLVVCGIPYRLRQTISTVPSGFNGSNFCSEILVSANGKFVYAGNRLHDSIAIFAVGPDGVLKYLGEEWTRGN